MDEFTVTLPYYGVSYTFDRNRFMTLFPNSLISTVLENTRDTDS